MPSTQKALIVREVGKGVVLNSEWPVPQPGPNQVLVKVSVAGINPHDQKIRDSGLLIGNKLPAILTTDVVGRVAQLGEGVQEYAVGDRIMLQATLANGSPQNGLQEYALADIGASAKIPDSVSDDEAATLPTNIIAPVVALFDSLRIPAPWSTEAGSFNYAGVTLLIVGGGSNCGKFGVQLAKLAGIGKIVVFGGPEDELKSYGATHVLDRHSGDEAVLEGIRAIVGDDLVYALDTVNEPEGLVLTLNALSSHAKGTVARLLPYRPVDGSNVVGKNAGFEVQDVKGSSHLMPHVADPFWQHVPTYLKQGKIKPLGFVVKEGLEANHVNAVLDAYRDGKKVTKTHIHV